MDYPTVKIWMPIEPYRLTYERRHVEQCLLYARRIADRLETELVSGLKITVTEIAVDEENREVNALFCRATTLSTTQLNRIVPDLAAERIYRMNSIRYGQGFLTNCFSAYRANFDPFHPEALDHYMLFNSARLATVGVMLAQ